MKKIVLSLLGSIIVSGIIGGNVFLNSHTKLDQKTKNDNVEIIETKRVSDSEIKTETEETKKSEQKEKEEKTEQVSNSESVKETTKQEQPKNDTNNTSSASKTESKKNTDVSTSSNQTQQKSNTTTSITTQPSNNTQNNNTQNNSQNTTPTQNNVVSTTFYDSITGGKREFSSESAAFARGTEIQNKELDYVLDWNETHPDNQIQPDINYFRVYPSAIDENGNYWYYLHFFCQSGEGNDVKLKSKY